MTALSPKTRGDAILAVMQAQRAHRTAERTPPLAASTNLQFDEAHAVIERLQADGYLTTPPAAA
ncbi:hypothetical protein [Rhodococcus opacus]|uniref:hypothetical protein n=1 Tax=Rhodococcus opacus TaxID=37919 RepID=UPI001C43E0D1|nr:hypothetical protein [Rhodococcus opacus]MBV6758374.1 hypothetical protein [Rhodococcus opacus]